MGTAATLLLGPPLEHLLDGCTISWFVLPLLLKGVRPDARSGRAKPPRRSVNRTSVAINIRGVHPSIAQVCIVRDCQYMSFPALRCASIQFHRASGWLSSKELNGISATWVQSRKKMLRCRLRLLGADVHLCSATIPPLPSTRKLSPKPVPWSVSYRALLSLTTVKSDSTESTYCIGCNRRNWRSNASVSRHVRQSRGCR